MTSRPSPTRALVLGILAIAGVVVLITLPLGPLAWHQGAVALREIQRHPDAVGGRGEARAGMILGIIASAVLVVVLLGVVILAVSFWVLTSVETGYST